MCREASFIVADNGRKVFWSKYSDSHEDIIKKYGLVESVAGKVCFVRVEVSPVGGSSQLMTDFADWNFRVDQDLLPDWWDSVEAEKMCRVELPKWRESKCFAGGVMSVNRGKIYLFNNSSAGLFGNSSAGLSGNSSARLYDNSSARLYGKSSAELFGKSSAVLFSSSATIKEKP